MEIRKHRDGGTLTVEVEGCLDTVTSKLLEDALKEELTETDGLVLDFEKLDYISSAGLRTLLVYQKALEARGGLRIIHADENIKEVFEITGFINILKVE